MSWTQGVAHFCALSTQMACQEQLNTGSHVRVPAYTCRAAECTLADDPQLAAPLDFSLRTASWVADPGIDIQIPEVDSRRVCNGEHSNL